MSRSFSVSAYQDFCNIYQSNWNCQWIRRMVLCRCGCFLFLFNGVLSGIQAEKVSPQGASAEGMDVVSCNMVDMSHDFLPSGKYRTI